MIHLTPKRTKCRDVTITLENVVHHPLPNVIRVICTIKQETQQAYNSKSVKSVYKGFTQDGRTLCVCVTEKLDLTTLSTLALHSPAFLLLFMIENLHLLQLH